MKGGQRLLDMDNDDLVDFAVESTVLANHEYVCEEQEDVLEFHLNLL